MRRSETLFLVVLLGAAVVGGASLVSFSDSLAVQELVSVLQDRVEADVTAVAVENRSLVVRVRFENPSGSRLAVDGGYFAVFRNDSRLAYGSASLDPPLSLPPRGSATTTFRVQLSPSQAERVRAARDAGGFDLANRYSVSIADSRFTLRNDRVAVPSEVSG